MTSKSESYISIKGARVNNLKNIEVNIPRNKIVVITGLSGSGKSSLAFDTLYAEGKRRYIESLPTYIQQFLGKTNKPKVDSITGLPPAIAIDQKIDRNNSRSTVATSTELYHYLRIIFARIGKTFSPITGNIVNKHQVSDVIKEIFQYPAGTKFILLTQINPINSCSIFKQLKIFMQEGFSRVELKGKIYYIHDVLSKKISQNFILNQVYLLIDRSLIFKDDASAVSRLYNSIETAFLKGDGKCIIRFFLKEETISKEFSKKIEADGMKFKEPSEDMFNFNNPVGACSTCNGFGTILGISEDLVIPNTSLSLYEDAVACWKGEKMNQWKQDFIQKSSHYQFPIHCPYKKLTQNEKKLLWNGNKLLYGIYQFFKHIEENSYKIQYKILHFRYQAKTICPSCRGKRLNSQALYVKIGGKDIASLMALPVVKVQYFLKNLQLNEYEKKVTKYLLEEICNRLKFLKEVGLGYLTLDRLSSTLSGGESQRINLTKVLGNNLSGSLYVLDEPSLGLHARDIQLLIKVLKKLQILGNTVVVIEHDEEIICAADHIIDIGPNAGNQGGKIVYQGKVKTQGNFDSYTLRYLIGKEKIEVPLYRRNSPYFIEIKGIQKNNLKNLDVRFPLNIITVITGVSGSGKSSLMHELYKNLKKKYEDHSKISSILGDLNRINKVQFIDQHSIGRSTRSNPVTYIKAYDEIRKLFANQPLSKQMRFTPSHFSFNIKGGRCESCKGEGVIRVEMQFMSDIYLNCESCHGKRFSQDILNVKYYDNNIYDILNMTIDEAIDFLEKPSPHLTINITKKLKTLQKVGLGYVKLGQNSTTLSSGENQRVKLAYFLGEEKFQPTLFIFDEPSTGLHLYDIKILLKTLGRLINKGHTIIIIEHHLDIIKIADYVIDLGPEGGENGGFLIATGTPEEIAANKKSITGQFLKKKLSIFKI